MGSQGEKGGEGRGAARRLHYTTTTTTTRICISSILVNLVLHANVSRTALLPLHPPFRPLIRNHIQAMVIGPHLPVSLNEEGVGILLQAALLLLLFSLWRCG